MNKISTFLEKFASFGQKEKEEKELIIKTLKQILGIEIKREEIEVKDLNIKIKISGVKKTEIILNKNKILEEINQGLDLKFKDIN